MDRNYVSEFTQFMNRFLAEHPKVVADQRRGWNIHWKPIVDPRALEDAEADRIPYAAYESDPPVRHAKPAKSTTD